MPTANPYDRRRLIRSSADLSMPFVGNAGRLSSPPGIERQDLDAMVDSAWRRGQSEAIDRLERDHGEQLANARREAWEAGHTAGVADGETAVVERGLGQHGKTVTQVIAHLNDVIENNARLKKSDLVRELAHARFMLTALHRSLAQGFREVE